MLPTQNYLPAILWMLLSTFIWTVIFSAGKFADGTIGVFQLTFFRYVGGLMTLLSLLPSKGGFRAHISRQTQSAFRTGVMRLWRCDLNYLGVGQYAARRRNCHQHDLRDFRCFAWGHCAQGDNSPAPLDGRCGLSGRGRDRDG